MILSARVRGLEDRNPLVAPFLSKAGNNFAISVTKLAEWTVDIAAETRHLGVLAGKALAEKRELPAFANIR